MPMTSPRSSAGDPTRTLELLWRDSAATSRRGPAQGLSIGAVVMAAIALADQEGLEAVTIRRVAERLGVYNAVRHRRRTDETRTVTFGPDHVSVMHVDSHDLTVA